MNSSKCRANTRVLLNEIDSALQIAAAKEYVIEHVRHLIHQRRNVRLSPLRGDALREESLREQRIWKNQSASCEANERAARNAVSHISISRQHKQLRTDGNAVLPTL